MEFFLHCFLVFIIYSILGWIVEVIFNFIIEKKLINRGFLIGPVCPIYGFGAIIMMLYLTQYKENILTVFIMGTVLCRILEYITSYIMEKIFKARWWDYTELKFNINGRVCLYFSCLFGIGGVITVCFINPIINNLINLIPHSLMLIISSILFILFLLDIITSFNIINKVKLTAQNVAKDYTEEINKKVSEVLKNKIFQSRILKAFPKFNFNFFNRQKNKK